MKKENFFLREIQNSKKTYEIGWLKINRISRENSKSQVFYGRFLSGRIAKMSDVLVLDSGADTIKIGKGFFL